MRRAAIFVLSDVRSGSTLLDLCLGTHPSIVSLGEVHWLPAYVLKDRSIYDPAQPLVCTCGSAVGDCPFWRQIAASLGRPLASLELRPRFAIPKYRENVFSMVRRLPKRYLRIAPGAYRFKSIQRLFGGSQMANDCVDLFDAVSAATGCPFCVDSSKSPFRFRAVYAREPLKTKAIVLVRDFRAVVHSKMKRGQSLETAAMGWRARMNQIDALTRDLPTSCVLALKYESFCADPRGELERICGFLDLELSERTLHRTNADTHHIGGSPSKFDVSRSSISLDTSYENVFQPGTVERLRQLVGNAATKWGY